MNRLYFSKFLLLVAVLLGWNAAVHGQGLTYTFSYQNNVGDPHGITGTSVRYFTVPLGTSQLLSVDVEGARGGYSTYGNIAGNSFNGNGGGVSCTINVTPGQVLQINLGDTGQVGAGGTGATTGYTHRFGGFNGGGDGINSGGGGGGASDIRIGAYTLTDRIVVAGGGGGWGGGVTGAPGNPGGCGGGLTGEAGYYGASKTNTSNTGQGGTQTAGGAKATNSLYTPTNGSLGQGGQGADNYDFGGGGGGGYYGGGGASVGGGGGGSSYTNPTYVPGASVTHTQCTNPGQGSVTFTADCITAVAGAIVGPATVCAGDMVTYTNTTSSGGGTWVSRNPSVVNFPSSSSGFARIGTVTVPTTVIIVDSISYACNPAAWQKTQKTVTVYPVPDPIRNDGPSVSGVPVLCAGSSASLFASGPGVWTSSNTNIASVTAPVPGSVTVNGVAAGTAVISYTLPSTLGSCMSIATASVNPVPAPIVSPGGIIRICQTLTPGSVTFSDASPGGAWAWTSATGAVSFDPATATINTMNSGTGVVTYSFTATSCAASMTFSVDAKPTAQSVLPAGISSRCSNGDGILVSIIGSEAGVKYQLYNKLVPVSTPVTATGPSVDFGKIKDSGYYSVIATSPAGCVTNMIDSAIIMVNPAPTAYPLRLDGSPVFCADLPGPNIILDNSNVGVNPGNPVQYQVYRDGIADQLYSGNTATNPSIVMGPFTQSGTYTVIATDPTTTCFTPMTGSYKLTIQPLPQADIMGGGGHYCLHGAGVSVTMQNSVSGVDYALYRTPPGGAGLILDTTVPGTGAGFAFRKATLPGTYTVLETNHATGCYINATSTDPIVINIDPLPQVDTVTGTGTICKNSTTGVPVTLKATLAGLNYQLYKDMMPTGVPITGDGTTGMPLGTEFTDGVYTATATDPATGCVSNMAGQAVVTTVAIPTVQAVTGGGSYCAGSTGLAISIGTASEASATYQRLRNNAPYGTPIRGNGGTISFSSVTDTGNYTVIATNHTTGCSNTMAGSAAISISELPVQYAVSGGGNYCAGNAGVHISLPYSSLGVNYTLFHGATVASASIAGSNSGLDFGLYDSTGVYSVVGVNASTTCSVTMLDTVSVTTSLPPLAFPVTGSGSSFCTGDPGIAITLAGSQGGVKYQFFRSGTAVDTPVAGTGLALDFGVRTLPGTYSITATDVASGCTNNMSGNAVVTVNSLPSVYTVTGGGIYCAGDTGVHVQINNSDTAVKYQLYTDGHLAGTARSGTGGLLDFGAQTTAGMYTVMAVNPKTTCVSSMSGSAAVTVKAIPAAYPVTGGGDICSGGTGKNIMLSRSEAGVTYQLYNNGVATDAPISGTTTAVDFGIHSAPGKYTVTGTRSGSGCASAMTDSAMINILPLPTGYTLSGGGTFCEGSAVPHVIISGSVTGVNYQLYNGTTAVGTFISGSGRSIDFGTPVVTGIYNVLATDAITGCSANMLSPVSLTINPLPGLQTMSGNGHYCSGTSGTHLGLISSTAGINYQLSAGGTPVGSTMPGGGYAVDFGLINTPGSYTVTGTDAITGCAQTMTGSIDVVVDSLTPPSVAIATGAKSDTLCAGRSYTFTANTINGGSAPVYSWTVNGGSPAGYDATFSYVPVNGDIIGVTLTSNAACALPAMTYDNIIITTQTDAKPAVTISASPATAVCAGTPVTFTAVPVNGGYEPGYEWYINNKLADTAITFTYVPTDKDVVIFRLKSSYVCRLADTVFSNTYELSVDAPVVPAVTIIATQGTTLVPGQADTFIAAATHVGLTPKYQWLENGAPIYGATNSVYASNQFFDKDSITCQVMSSTACGLWSYNSVVIHLCPTCPPTGALLVKQASAAAAAISVVPNPNKGEFSVRGSLGIPVVTGADEPVALEITNMLGQVVYNKKPIAPGGNINEHVQLGNTISPGMYLLNVRSAAGNNVYHIVIEQ